MLYYVDKHGNVNMLSARAAGIAQKSARNQAIIACSARESFREARPLPSTSTRPNKEGSMKRH